MRRPALALVLAALALLPGCLQGGSVTSTDATVRPESFDAAGARWVVTVAASCSLCPREGGFSTDSDAWALFLFENDRVLLVEFNLRPGDRGFATDRRITHSTSELRELVQGIPWARGSGVWVNRIQMGKLDDPSLRLGLAKAWTLAGVQEPCADCEARLYRFSPWSGDLREQQLSGALRASDPFLRFVAPLDIVEAGVRQHGVLQGIPRAASAAG